MPSFTGVHADRHIARQNVSAHGRTGMLPAVAEDFHHQVGVSVHGGGHVVKVPGAVDKAQRLDKVIHPVQAANIGLDGAQHIQPAQARCLIRGGFINFSPHAANIDRLAGFIHRVMCGKIQHIARQNGFHGAFAVPVCLLQGNAQLFHPLFCNAHGLQSLLDLLHTLGQRFAHGFNLCGCDH